MLALIATTWIVKRRRRKRKQRLSALRNVTLVVRDEEEKREKEERRLTRGNSVRSKLGRNSSLKEQRERTYSKRVARALASEKKELHREHHKLPSESSASEKADWQGNSTSSPPQTPLGRHASVKQRDREVAERVWKVPDTEDQPTTLSRQSRSARSRRGSGGRQRTKSTKGPESLAAVAAVPLTTAAVASARRGTLDRDIEAEAASSGDLSDKAPEDLVDESESEASEEEVITNGQHWASRRREDSHQLSVIGETGLSEGMPSADVSRDASVSEEKDVPQAESSKPSESATVAAPLAEYFSANAQSQITIPGRRSSVRRTPSQRSRYTTATSASNYTTATGAESTTDDDLASLRTARTGGTVTAVPSERPNDVSQATPRTTMAQAGPKAPAAALVRQDSRRDSDPFRSPVSASSSHGNPFGSPTQSSSGGHSTFASVPVLVVPPSGSSETQTVKLPTESMPPTEEAKSGLARKWSNVVRLRSPVPPTTARSRGASPTPSNRSASISSVTAGGRRTSPSPALTGESWAYSSRATEWKQKRQTSSSSVPTLKGMSDSATQHEGSVPPVPAIAIDSTRSSAPAAEHLKAAPATSSEGRQWLEPEKLDTGKPTTTPGADATPRPATGASAMQRKGSIGVAGSRFKESFE